MRLPFLMAACSFLVSIASAVNLRSASQFFIFQYSPTPTGNSEIQNAYFVGDVGLASTTKRLVFSNVIMTGNVYRVNSGIQTGVPTSGSIIEDPELISDVSDQIYEEWIDLWSLESDEYLGDVDYVGDLVFDYTGSDDKEIVVDADFFRHTDGSLTVRGNSDQNFVFRVKDGLELGRSDIVLDGINAGQIIIAAGDPGNTVDGGVEVKMDYGTWYGTLFAPYALAELVNLSGFEGMVIAEEVKLRGEDDDVIISHVVPPILKNEQTITSFTPTNLTAFTAADTAEVSAEASSGLTVSFQVIDGPGQLAGNLLSFTGAGTVRVEASQAGDDDWNAAAPLTNTYTVVKADQVITSFIPADGSSYSVSDAADLSAEATSGLAVSFSVVSGPGIVNGSTLTFSGAGTVEVAADQAGNDIWNAAASVVHTYNAVEDSQVISDFTPADGSVFAAADVTNLSAAASSGLPVSFSVAAGPGVISGGNVLSFSSTGTVSVIASQSGDDEWSAAVPLTNTYTVGKADQFITGFTPADGSAFITSDTADLSASASSGLDVSFSIVSGPGVISGDSELIFTGAGTVLAEASQPGNAYWNAAEPVTNAYTVGKADQVLSGFIPTNGTTFLTTDTDTMEASASSGLTAGFNIISGPAFIVGRNDLHFTGPGTVTAEAYQSGNDYWNAAAPLTNTYTVAKQEQTISGFTPADGSAFVTTDSTNLEAVASSGLDVSFTVVSGPGSIASGNMLSFSGAGSVAVEAFQDGDADWGVAVPVTNVYTVSAADQNIIDFTPADGSIFQEIDTAQLSASAASGLDVDFELVSGLASISAGNVLSFSGTGTVAVRAVQDGSADWNAAAPVTNTYTVTKSDQVITNFLPQTLAVFGTTNTPALSADASSGLPVEFRVVLGPGVIDTNTWTLSFTNSGSVRVEASQSGDDDWNAAVPVTNAYSVGKVSATVIISNTNQVYTGSPLSVDVSTTPVGLPLLTAYEIDSVWSTNLPVDAGTYGVVSGIDEDPVYHGYAVSELTISKAGQTISGFSPTNGSSFLTTDAAVLSAAASSGLDTRFTVISGPGSVVGGNNLVFTNIGTVVVTASQEGDGNWNAAPELTNTYTVTKADQTISGFTPADGTTVYVGSTTNLSASASSGLEVSFSVIDGSAVIIGENRLVFSYPGTVKVEAAQDGDADWSAAEPVTNTYTVIKVDQSISGFTPADGTAFLTTDTAELDAAASSKLDVSFSVVSGPGIISSGNALSFSGTGTVSVAAGQAGNAFYNAAASVTNTYTVSKDNQTISSFIPADGTHFLVTDRAELSASASSGLDVDFNVVSGPGTLSSGDTLSFSATGTVQVAAVQNGNSDWNAAVPLTNTYTVGKADQLISGFTPADGTAFLTTDITNLSASASSGLEVSFEVISGPGYIIGGETLHFSSRGTVAVAASQPGNSEWNPAPSVTNVYTAAKAGQFISGFTPTNGSVFLTTDSANLSASASSGLSVSFTVVSGPAVITGGDTLSISGDGEVLVEAAQDGNSIWNAAVSVTNSYTVIKESQVISGFTPAGGSAFLTTDYTNLSASASSGLEVSFAVVSGPGLITSGSRLSFYGAGEVLVEASQAGDDDWYAAAPLTNSYTVSKADAVITLSDLSQAYDGGPHPVTAVTVPAGLSVALTYGGIANAPTNPGSYIVTGSIDDTYYAGSVTNTLTVTPGDQSIINFTPVTFSAFEVTNEVSLVADSTSGLPVSFAVVSGLGSIDTNTWTLSFSGAGAVEVEASQDGNANWNAAQPVTNTYSVGKSTASITVSNTNQIYTGSALHIDTSTSPTGLTVLVGYEIDGRWVTTEPVDAGTYAVVAGVIDDPEYQAAAEAVLTIAPADQSITNFTPAGGTTFLTTNVVTLSAGATSGLDVEFTVIDGPGEIVGSTLSFYDSIEPVLVEAAQPGDGNWNAAVSLTNSYTVFNSLPVFTSVPITAATQGVDYSYIVTTDDIDGDTVSISAPVLPSWLTLDRLTLGSSDLNGRPGNASVGTHPVVLVAYDGDGGSSTQAFDIVVGDVNDDPAFISTPVTFAAIGVDYSYTAAAMDVDGDTVTISAAVQPGWTTFTNNTLSGVPTAAETNTVILVAADGNGGTATQTFELVSGDYLPPPELMSAVNITNTQFVARWKAAENALGYYIDVSTSTNFAETVTGYTNLNVGDVTCCLVTGLTENTVYYYQLRAEYSAGLSADSDPSDPVLTSDDSTYTLVDYTNAVVSVGAFDYLSLDELFKGSGLEIAITTNTRPGRVSAVLEDDGLLLNYLAFGEALVELRAVAPNGSWVRLPIELTIVEKPVLDESESFAVNVQNGLYEKTVYVENASLLSADTVTLTVTNMTDDTTLYNATDTDYYGRPEIKWAGVLAGGGTASFILQLHTAKAITPDAAVEASLTLIPPDQVIDRLKSPDYAEELTGEINGDGQMVVGFSSEIGETYYIQYRDSLEDEWGLAYPAITAITSWSQWVDHGPPFTDTEPGDSRFYRVVQFED